MRLIPKIFLFNEEDVPPELRAQRKLNLSRIPELTSYLTYNQKDYTLSALTASIDGQVLFEPFSETGAGQSVGMLTIPMDARILINDGQHRRAAIEEAIKDCPDFGYDNIPVLFFIDEGLERSQQMFADLNKHAVRPSESISSLYDLRDGTSELARHMAKNVSVFIRMTEMEKSSISNRSSKLFTLSAIKNATKTLLSIRKGQIVSKEERDSAVQFWNQVGNFIPMWVAAQNKEISTCELREGYIHAHGVMLQAMGVVGSQLLMRPEREWRLTLAKLVEIDWSRSNTDWEGRALVHGRVSKSSTNVLLTANYIKQKLGMPLLDSEFKIEQEMRK